MGSREARSLGAVYMGGRRVQQPAQEEPPRPAALSCDRDSHEPVPEHASRRRTELYRKPLLMPALSTSCCSGGACNHAPDTSSFDTGAGAEGEEGDGIAVGGLEGFRLIDIALLNEFLQTKVVCRQCAESSLQDQLRQFAAFADGRGADTVTGHLQAYLHNLSRHATRKNAGLCGVQIVSETLEGGAQSTFRVECVHHQRQHELRYNKAHRGAKISPVELVTSATVNTVDQQTGRVRRGEKLAEVNVRIAAAFDNIGRGAVDAANVCAFLNLPLSGKEARAFERVFQSAERAIVGPAYEAAAHAGCEAVQETVRQRQLASTDPRFAPLVDAETGEQLVGFVAAGDGSWCKKGSGHKYDSLGGTYTLYDAETNKVVFFITYCKSCLACISHRRKNNLPADAIVPDDVRKQHDCRQNHNGTSKSMEPQGAVDAANSLAAKGLRMECLVGDDDSSTRNKVGELSEECALVIQRRVRRFLADRTHRSRVCGNKAYKLVDTPIVGEAVGDTRITKSVAAKIKQCHGYMLTQYIQEQEARIADPQDPLTSYDVPALQKRWFQVREHMFDRHDRDSSLCGTSCADFGDWCSALSRAEEGELYTTGMVVKHVGKKAELEALGLRQGEMRGWLKGDAVYQLLTKDVFEPLGTIKKLQESCHPFNTQKNESGNMNHCRKAPKERDYTMSPSYPYRVSMSVVEINGGAAAHLDVFEQRMGLRPGRHFAATMHRRDRDSAVRAKKAAEPAQKAKRAFGSKAKSKAEAVKERSEGRSYSSGMVCDNAPTTITTIDAVAAATTDSADRDTATAAAAAATAAAAAATAAAAAAATAAAAAMDTDTPILSAAETALRKLQAERDSRTTAKGAAAAAARAEKKKKKGAAAKRRKVDNGAAGACSCGGQCKRGCPCKSANVNCGAACKCKSAQCKNTADGKCRCNGRIPLHGLETELPADTTYEGQLNHFLPLLPQGATAATLAAGAATIVTFDFEANGGSTHTHKPIQLAAKRATVTVTVDTSDPVVNITAVEGADSEFSELIQCEGPIPKKITQLTGIDQARLAREHAKSPKQVVEAFLRFLDSISGPVILAGHNVNIFDVPLLYAFLDDTGYDAYTELRKRNVIGVLDTLWLARHKADWGVDAPANMRLGTLHQHELDAILEGAHDALNDVVGNLRLLQAPTLLEAMRDHLNGCVVSLEQSVARIRSLRHDHRTQTPNQQRDVVRHIEETLEFFNSKARIKDTYLFDDLSAVSDEQAGFFRMQIHQTCKSLGLRSEKQGESARAHVKVTML